MVGGYLYDYGMAEGYGRPYASGVNPAGAIQLDKNEYQSHSFNGNAMFEATFLKDFKGTVNFGLQYLGTKNNELTNPYYGDAEGLGRISKHEYILQLHVKPDIVMEEKFWCAQSRCIRCA